MKRALIVAGVVGVAAAVQAGQQVTARMETHAVVVEVEGKLFTQYRFVNPLGKKPYAWPLAGPASGQSVTTESSDPYPHHNSMWFGCDHINGGDYWHHQNPKGKQVSRGPQILVASGETVVFEDVCEWKPDTGNPVMSDFRRITVSAPDAYTRIVDFNVVWVANEPIKITKTNHSLFALRMAPALSVQQGGTMVTSDGDAGEKGTFGKVAPWMDCFGTRDGVVEGAAILQHPSNRWYPSPWFTRDYGFFSPTPMYWLDKGVLDLASGESVSLAYRVVVHAGDTQKAGIAARFDTYAQSTPAVVTAYLEHQFDSCADGLATYAYGQSRLALMAIEDVVNRSSNDPAARARSETRLLKLLARPGVTTAGRDHIVRLLSLVGGKSSVPALEKLLLGGDGEAASLACFALERIPTETAGVVLRRALTGVEGLRQAAVATALGTRRDSESVSALAALLVAKDPVVRAAAAQALAHIGGKESVRVLGDTWRAGDGSRIALTDALLTACEAMGAEAAQGTDAASVCRAVYKQSPGGWQKLGALRALLTTDPVGGSELLKSALSDKDAQLSAGAARLLEQMPGQAVTQLAVSQLETMDSAGQAAMLRTLTTRGDRSAAAGVRRFVDSEDDGVRAAALDALGALGGADDLPLLTGKLPHAAAARALESLKGDGIAAGLVAVLSRSEGDARLALVKVLRGRGESAAAPQLLAMVADPDSVVAREALRALGELGGQAELNVLMKQLSSDMASAALRKEIEAAVAALAVRLGGTGQASAPVLTALRDVSPVGRASLVRVLGRLGEDSGLKAVVSAASSPLPTVKDAGVRTLAEWPGGAALAPLLTVAEQTRELTHHVLAMRGYIRLLKGMTDRLPSELKVHYDAGKAVARREEEKAALAFEVKGVVIRDLQVKSTATYHVHFGGLREGVVWASDRDYRFDRVPNSIRGATYIETVMNDRAIGGADFMSFVVDEPVAVYVGFDNRCKALPGWLKGWQRLDESIQPPAKTGCHLVLYLKHYDNGRVTLGGANAPGVAAMYCVAVKEKK